MSSCKCADSPEHLQSQYMGIDEELDILNSSYASMGVLMRHLRICDNNQNLFAALV